jgi:hypothetical protein
MGKRGPLPAKGLQRKKGKQAAIDAAITVGQIEVDVEAPYEPNDAWHPIARSTYDSVQRSGQAEFYTESDWAKLYLVCDQLSLNLKPTFVGFAKQAEVLTVNGKEEVHYINKPIAGVVPMNGATLNAIQAMMTSLGISEGDRRRMGIELVRKKSGADASQAEIEARRDAELVEAMRTGKVVKGDFDQASGE